MRSILSLNRRRLALVLPASLALVAVTACSKNEPPAAQAPAVKPTPAEAYALAQQGHGFTVGAMMAANTVYVFFDTTCPHCAELWAAAKPLQGRLKMVWMPVGLLRPSSTPQGATILAAPDPAAAMQENETLVLERKGGITANPSLGDDVLAKVKANTDLFTRIGGESVPLIVYKNGRSGSFGVHPGAVDTTTLASLVGLS